MLESLDWKMLAAIAAIVIGLWSQVLYFRAMFRGETKPHAYTWLIWAITLGTASAGLLQGGGGTLVSVGLIIGTINVFAVFLLSFWFGTKNVTYFDTLTLIAALAAIFVWWQLDQPILAVLMVCGIDALGYVPTFRKSWKEPWGEDIPAWLLISVSYFFSVLALEAYNFLTVPYLATIMVANVMLISILLYRRRTVPKPA